MKVQMLMLVVWCACASADDDKSVEARGKGKYALLTHLAILLATKVGLYKLVTGIALVIAAVKAMVLLAWTLAIFKYVPDLWQHKQWHEQSLPGWQKHGLPNAWHEQSLPGWQKHGLPDAWQRHSPPGPGPSASTNLLLDMLTMHFFYVAATKLFVLKLVYGVIFYVMATKAWHLLLWLVHYLKEKKHEHYVEIDHDFHGHHDFHDQEYGVHNFHGQEYGVQHFHGQEYGAQEYEPQYGPYGYDKHGRLDKDKRIYDADGSYSVVGY